MAGERSWLSRCEVATEDPVEELCGCALNATTEEEDLDFEITEVVVSSPPLPLLAATRDGEEVAVVAEEEEATTMVREVDDEA